MGNIKQSILAGVFSIITIGMLTSLTYKTEFGVFLLASFLIVFCAFKFIYDVFVGSRLAFISLFP